MLCDVCLDTFSGLDDPSQTKIVCSSSWFDEYRGANKGRHSTAQGGEEKFPDDFEAENRKRDPKRVRDWVYGHHTSWQSLLDSQERDCMICCSFTAEENNLKFQEELSFATVFKIESKNFYRNHLEPDDIEWYIRLYSDKSEKIMHLAPYLVDNTGMVNHQSSTFSRTTWEVIEQWLYDCLDKHACGHTINTQFLPTRLLELSVQDSNCSFRLVHRHEIDPGARYLTLSHCWGTNKWDERLILTESNLASLKKNQSIEILPKTFKDAFIVLKRLGVRYLWIDRLCIQQDSTEDWRIESASMAEVYRNSHLNIAASGSENDGGGCFFKRGDYLQSGLATFRFRLGSSHEPVIYRLWGLEDYRNTCWSLQPLLNRAWVLQERILAPRVLYFGRQMVFWECYKLHASEPQPNFCIPGCQDTSIGKSIIALNPYRVYYSTGLAIDKIFHDWYRLLGDYTQLRMTKPGDKLVAISAIAKQVKQVLDNAGLDSAYLAGIWRHRLPGSLLWSVSKPIELAPPDEHFQSAPSWSWAAISGTYHSRSLDDEFIRIYATVLASYEVTVHCEDASKKDDLTNIDGISLLLSGRKMVAHTFVDLNNDVAIQSLDGISFESRPYSDKEYLSGTILFDHDKEYRISGLSEVWCLPIVITPSRLIHAIYGLALRSEGHCYRRIGLVQIYMRNKDRILEVIKAAPVEEFALI